MNGSHPTKWTPLLASVVCLCVPFVATQTGWQPGLDELLLHPSPPAWHLPCGAHTASSYLGVQVYSRVYSLDKTITSTFLRLPCALCLPMHPPRLPLQGFVIKAAMTFVSYAVGWQRVRLVLMLLLSARLLWIYLRWAPHMYAWVNHVRAGMYSAVVCVAAMAVVLVFGTAHSSDPDGNPKHTHHKRVTELLWIVIGGYPLQRECVCVHARTCVRACAPTPYRIHPLHSCMCTQSGCIAAEVVMI